MNKDISVIIAAHKKYKMPEDGMYIPMQVGSQGKPDIGYIRDNTGDNISDKNRNFCELTGMYWLWKNDNSNVKGLVHYRRYFLEKKCKDKWEAIASKDYIEGILKDYDIILPKMRNYYIETNYSQYIHAHHKIDLDLTREIIAEKYSEYFGAYDKSMKMTKGHRFNMMIMKKKYFDEYCEWLFDILFELEKRLDISGYSDYDARVFGFVSERLLDVTKYYRGRKIEVSGQFRSYNRHEGVKNKLVLSIFVRELRFIEDDEVPEEQSKSNQIFLDGYVCKPPIYRKTPLGREIADILVAVNRPYGKSDYIPCIAWGRNARFAGGLEVGSHLQICGRVQSREYTKKIGEEEVEKRVAYEVSVSKIDLVEDEE